MFGFFKKLFGGGNDAEGLVERVMERSQRWVDAGAEIAQDCLQNGLSKGEIVRLSEIENFIKQNYPYNESVVKNGFLLQMNFYMDQNIVINFMGEGGDFVFVHKDFVNEILNMK
ncbi:MAG: hypothetical protein CVU60_11455 [Deltaproteobacteria bacterium HGW-Deltaproteobacteria-18]|jgi:hypothetical protein|nr:MAG: hypothetical protein CVU60_11455 [Deltaproteobacteria bacterium HGW-Deltaproteobacteria-18]